LSLLGISFEIRVSHADETMEAQLSPAAAVAQVSRKKAAAISRESGQVVIAADTIVVCDSVILGKPVDPENACQMLRLLSGRSHQVMTGMTVLSDRGEYTCTEITEVCFRELTEQEIRRYVASGDPMDKAGAYGIQSGAALFAEKLIGDYYNVMACRYAGWYRYCSRRPRN
jgi:septum formation protein